MQQSEHVAFGDAVALLSESSSALDMVLPCPRDAHSKSGARFLRDPGARASAVNSVVNSDFEKAKEREVSNWLANLVTERAARSVGIKPIRRRWWFTIKDNCTAKARIVLLGCQDHRLRTSATASHTIAVRGRNLALHGDMEAAFPQSQPRGTSPRATSSHGIAQHRNRAAPQESIRAER